MSFLTKDAKKTYEEEKNNGAASPVETASYGEAEVSSSNGEYVWTWEIVTV